MPASRRDFIALTAASPLIASQSPGDSGFTPLNDGWQIIDGPESSFVIKDGEIAVSPFTAFPTWLRSSKEYENFDLRGEFFIKGWTDSGIYIHAPLHGRPTWCGMQMKVFHQKDEKPTAWSCGAILPVVAPSRVPVRQEWNDFRILCDWPHLQVWINGDLVHDIDMSAHPDLRHRLRAGYLGIAAASAPCRFRNLRIKELPSKLQWTTLYGKPADLDANWAVSEGKPDFTPFGPILRSDALGHLATKAKYRDFEFECYFRGCAQHNGGVIFRSEGRGTKNAKSYEIQLHPVEEAHFPTGSLYHLKRAVYPRIEDEKWFLFQLRVEGKNCMVRINGDTVLEYSDLDNLNEGFIELQAHRRGYWTEFQRIRVRKLDARSND